MNDTINRINQADHRSRYIPSELGKLPPQAVDIEEAVIGAILIQKEAFLEASEIIHAQAFYKDSNQTIFKAATNLFNAHNPIDILTVQEELRKMGKLEEVGGGYYLTELSSRVSSSANMEYHAKVVMEKFLQREVIRISVESMNAAYEDTTDVFDLIEKSQSETFSLLGAMNKKEIDDMGAMMMDFVDELEKKPVEGLTGIGSGFNEIDRLTGGWQPTDLIIIAARPGMGKTAFVLKNARNAAIIHKKPVLIFSLEMSSQQLIQRMVSDESDILYEKIKKKNLNDLDFKIINQNISNLASCNIFIDDTPSLNIFDLRIKARRMKQKYGIELIIVDYLQLMDVQTKNKNTSREQEIAIISKTLKAVAKELNVPVIALAQLSRAVESRPAAAKRPQLSDLRDSGSIEQDADQVGFLYRPEYYQIYQDANGQSTVGLCELIFAKNRAGICETIKLDFNGAYMRFKDWSSPDLFTTISSESKF